ncbi:hypothetical protein [Spongiimicrobium salis]|uniref:hypothetical protein n=1 Tax=Spongiimicrobium salis TaxID=1667022 RepID=UPI00374D398E
MKKTLVNIGKILSKSEQRQISGGSPYTCSRGSQASCDEYCHSLMIIYTNDNPQEARDGALQALEDNCGITVIGGPSLF